MTILHFRLQSQFKYELFHIYFTTESFTMSDQLFGVVQILSNKIKHVETFVFDRKTFFSPQLAQSGHFELFWSSTKLPLRKPENRSLLT